MSGEYVARYRYAKVSPRKARLVMDKIRGCAVGQADDILRFSDRRAAVMIRKALASAVANAEKQGDMDRKSLKVIRCFIDCAPVRKGWIPRSRGMATPLIFRSSHITIFVGEGN